MTFSLLFIVGVGRSGTSLLQSMFAAHPKVACLPETAFLRRMVSCGILQSVYENQGKQAVVQALEKDEYFCRTGIDADDLIAKALARGGLLDADLYLQMLASYTCGNKIWVGDKDPRAIEYLPLLKTLCPDVHVIHMIRDPRDVLISKKKAYWSRKGHVWKHVFANRVQFRTGRKLGPELFGARYHEVCYEDLLSSPQKVLRELCKKLGIAYDERMLAFGIAAKKLVSEKELSWKKETFGPLLTKNKEKWKTDLPFREIKLSELCCRRSMTRGGYKPDEQRHVSGFWDRLWIQAVRLVIVLATRPYMLYRDLRVKRACRRMR